MHDPEQRQDQREAEDTESAPPRPWSSCPAPTKNHHASHISGSCVAHSAAATFHSSFDHGSGLPSAASGSVPHPMPGSLRLAHDSAATGTGRRRITSAISAAAAHRAPEAIQTTS